MISLSESEARSIKPVGLYIRDILQRSWPPMFSFFCLVYLSRYIRAV